MFRTETTTTSTTRRILAASFGTADGAVRAATAVTGAYPEKVSNTAIVYIKADGTAKFTETLDWGTGRGALVGGAIGLLGGPLGVLAGGTIGALATKLRDVGFPDSQLRDLGATLGQNDSVVVFDIAADAVDQASKVLQSMEPKRIVDEPVSASVANLFA